MNRIYEKFEEDCKCDFKDLVAVERAYHSHDGFEVYLFLDGEINYYIEQYCYPLMGSELLLINPGEYHRAVLLDTVKYKRMTLNVSAGILRELSDAETDLTACFTNAKGTGKVLHLNTQELQSFIFAAKQLEMALNGRAAYGHRLLAKSCLLQVLVQLNRLFLMAGKQKIENTMPALVQKVIEYVEQNLTDHINLDDISSSLCFNSAYINRQFKKITGLTIGQYILCKKVDLAKRYLCENHSLMEVCELSGFNDYSNFSRTFTSRVGCSPSEYRK
ncbi:MAG TPA: AraC family transcriptional regulator [Lachnoclostridium sp.]|jgi:AraC-like DNA-binding protein|uniref:AraC family transcriptional regulator n=1 Tax=Lacrimispora sp. TaxID=2719234 RepID=UPI000EDE770D|nr:AraC family transcriptional regulator [Lacrimispora sp.]HCD46092.1 AraC family transcriptional regulator [Lachnoclostridium sp.]